MKSRTILKTMALLVGSIALTAHAADYSLDDGRVHFSAPDA